jgi:hypothetical protein
MLKSKTHFEQVPIDVVKKIAQIEVPQEAAEPLKPPPKKKCVNSERTPARLLTISVEPVEVKKQQDAAG